jgi:hypothetical protein
MIAEQFLASIGVIDTNCDRAATKTEKSRIVDDLVDVKTLPLAAGTIVNQLPNGVGVVVVDQYFDPGGDQWVVSRRMVLQTSCCHKKITLSKGNTACFPGPLHDLKLESL